MHNFSFKDGSDSFTLSWVPDTIETRVFDSKPHFYGVVFVDGQAEYDIVVNQVLGLRIHIREPKTYSMKDIPFNAQTCYFLPDQVRIEHNGALIRDMKI